MNCELSEWSIWSSCSVSCGGGTRSRSREVTTEAKWGGTECSRDVLEIETCGEGCCVPECDGHAVLRNSSQLPCGRNNKRLYIGS